MMGPGGIRGFPWSRNGVRMLPGPETACLFALAWVPLHAVKFTALGDVANHRIPRFVELSLAAAALEDWLLLLVRDEALGIQRSP